MLHVEHTDSVCTLTIDRPERRNAVDHHTLVLLHEAISTLTSATRVVVLTGAGGSFCAGADLTGVEDVEFRVALQRVLDGLVALPIVVLAAIDGPALGAGTQLAVACDVRVATERSRFGIPAARLGLMVDTWTVQRLCLAVGHSTARAMLMAAHTIDAVQAQHLGMVHRIGGLAAAHEWAAEIASLAPLTIAGHHGVLEELARTDGDSAATAAAITKAWSSNDAQEGRMAFLEKRPAVFGGE